MNKTKQVQIKFIFSYIPHNEYKMVDYVYLERKFLSLDPEIRIALSRHNNGICHYYLKTKSEAGISRTAISYEINEFQYKMISSMIATPPLIFKNIVMAIDNLNIEFRICPMNEKFNFGEVKLDSLKEYHYAIKELQRMPFFKKDVSESKDYSLRKFWEMWVLINKGK